MEFGDKPSGDGDQVTWRIDDVEFLSDLSPMCSGDWIVQWAHSDLHCPPFALSKFGTAIRIILTCCFETIQEFLSQCQQGA